MTYSTMMTNTSGVDFDEHRNLLRMLNARMAMMEEICNAVPCDETPIARFVMGPVYLFVFALALAGNVCNAAIYQSSCFRSSIAVRMLTFKAIANTVFIACHLPKAIYHVCPSSHALHVLSARTQSSALFVANTCGTVAIWLTVLIVLERYVAIVCPTRHRAWCERRADDTSMRRLCVVLALIVLLSTLLHSIHLVNRDMHVLECPEGGYLGDETEYHVVRVATHLGTWNARLEMGYNWMNMVCVIVIPLLLMMYFSMAVIFQFLNRRGLVERQSQMKHCVTQLTLWTMVIHVVLDAPSTVLYTAAAIWGMQFMHLSATMCYYKTMCHFAGMLEAAVPFYIYLAFSDRFRDVFLFVVLCRPPSRALQLQRTATETHASRRAERSLLTRVTSSATSAMPAVNGSAAHSTPTTPTKATTFGRSTTSAGTRAQQLRESAHRVTARRSGRPFGRTADELREHVRAAHRRQADIVMQLIARDDVDAPRVSNDVQLFWNHEESSTYV